MTTVIRTLYETGEKLEIICSSLDSKQASCISTIKHTPKSQHYTELVY